MLPPDDWDVQDLREIIDDILNLEVLSISWKAKYRSACEYALQAKRKLDEMLTPETEE